MVCGFGSTSAMADAVSGTMYYTTYAGTDRLFSADYSYDGAATFSITNKTAISGSAQGLLGGDGLLFAPNGNILVGGQTNKVYEVTTGGSVVTSVDPGGASFHLALPSNASDAQLYNLANGGCGDNCVSAVKLTAGGLPGSAGSLYTVSGGSSHDIRSLAYDTTNAVWYYGTAADGSTSGDFGTVVFDDTLHTATLTLIASSVAAHGLTFDPYTGDIIISSANVVSQYAPGSGFVSTFTDTAGIGLAYDQTAADGKGHVFAASNNGDILFLDYDATGLIASGFSDRQFLADALDDIAPLSGAGSHPTPEPATLMLMLLGGLAVYSMRRHAPRVTEIPMA
jgi:hypothetical protein